MRMAEEKARELLSCLCVDYGSDQGFQYPMEYRVLPEDKLARRKHPVIQVFRNRVEIASNTGNWLSQMRWWDTWISGFRAGIGGVPHAV